MVLPITLLVVGQLLVGALAQDGDINIECPVPGTNKTVSQTICQQYSACGWTDGLCHMLNNSMAGYIVASEPIDTGRGFQITLSKSNPGITMFGADIQELLYEVIYHENEHVQIKITDPANERYEVPVPISLPVDTGTAPLYKVYVGEVGTPFAIDVTRTDNNNNLLHSTGPITFEDQFLQFTARLDNKFLFGFGENPHTHLQREFEPRHTYAMFARDQPIDTSAFNHYGAFPYFVNIEDDQGNTHGVLLLNSNAMEYSTFLLSSGDPAVTIRSIGGIIDLHIFAGPTPEEVNEQLSILLGKAAFPPYWAFGFQLSRWGYNSTDDIRELRNRTRAAGIPQDVQFFDIDYMRGMHDFTYDPINFADLPELVAELNAENIRTIFILDPAIAINNDTNDPYSRGRQAGAFIRWLSPDLVPEGQPEEAEDFIVGHVWPEENAVFPDFFLPATKQWWSSEIGLFRQVVAFDGLWIDMNEPSNFGTNLFPAITLDCPDNQLDSPPYPSLATTQDLNESGRLSDRTICMSSRQSDGVTNFTHYDVHSLYGYSESIATFEAMTSLNPGKRPVILSRSTFPGSGRYAMHWLGDNQATWQHLRLSVIGLIEFNMFGIPMVGADICGFFMDSTEELCARWMQLGAFYPFSRNHNVKGAEDQDPAVWPTVAAISRDVLGIRYKYLPYLYTLFHSAHMRGSSVVRPLFNVFPSDISARAIEDQFFWGEFLMIAPVLDEGATSRTVYFPQGMWYGLVSEELEATGPVALRVDTPLERIPLYIRGGSVLPFQEPGLNTVESRLNDFGILVALEDGQASGEVFWDDGDEEHLMSENYFSNVTFSNNELTMINQYNPDPATSINLFSVRILGVNTEPSGVIVNDAPGEFTYDSVKKLLVVTVNNPLSEDLTITIL